MSSQYVTNALQVLLARLDPEHPAFTGSGEVRAILSDEIQPYIQSWVIPVIRCALDEPEYRYNREFIAQEALRLRKAARAKLTTEFATLAVKRTGFCYGFSGKELTARLEEWYTTPDGLRYSELIAVIDAKEKK